MNNDKNKKRPRDPQELYEIQPHERLAKIIDALGMEKQVIAGRLGISKAALSHYIYGNRKMSYEIIEKLAIEFGVNPSYFFHDNAEMFKRIDEKEKQKFHIPFFNEVLFLSDPHTINFNSPDIDKIEIDETIMNFFGYGFSINDLFIVRNTTNSYNREIKNDSKLFCLRYIPDFLENDDLILYVYNNEIRIGKFFADVDNRKIILRSNSIYTNYYDLSIDPNLFDKIFIGKIIGNLTTY